MTTVCGACGKEFPIKSSHFKRFKGPFTCSRSCRGELLSKVYRGNKNPNTRYVNEVAKFLGIRCTDIKRRCAAKNIPFDIDAQHLYSIYELQNGLCAYTGLPMKPASSSFDMNGQADLDALSVDRIMPALGYVKGNIALCCSAVNKMKGSAPVLELSAFLTGLALKSFGTCNIAFKRFNPNATAPHRAKLGDGGFDLTAVTVTETENQIIVDTGIGCEPSFGWVLQALPRSSIYKKHLELSNSVGLIDNQYRGSIKAVFDKMPGWLPIEPGERCLQLLPVRVPMVTIQEVEELSETERGTGGFGSSGK